MNKLKTNFITILKPVAFVSIFLLIFMLLSDAFIPLKDSAEDGMESRISKAYRGEPKDSVDVVFIGNSDMYRGVSPVDLYHSTGITSAIAGKPGKNFKEIPSDIKDILKYQKPKVLVIETDCMFSGVNSSFKKPPVKKSPVYNRIKNSVSNGDSALLAALNYKFPLIKYHNNWKDIRVSAILDRNEKYRFSNKGMAFSDNVEPCLKGGSYMNDSTGKRPVLTTQNKAALKKICQMCEEYNIKPVLLTVPSANSWNSEKTAVVNKISNDYNIPYYDYNSSHPAGFDWHTCTKDGGNHLNYTGAMTITKDIGNKLTEDLFLEKTKLTNKEKQQWLNDYNHFHNHIVKDNIKEP